MPEEKHTPVGYDDPHNQPLWEFEGVKNPFDMDRETYDRYIESGRNIFAIQTDRIPTRIFQREYRLNNKYSLGISLDR